MSSHWLILIFLSSLLTGIFQKLSLSSLRFNVLPGDATVDGMVNGADLNAVLSNYNKAGVPWVQVNFYGNGTVNGADLNVVLSNYNATLPSGNPAGTSAQCGCAQSGQRFVDRATELRPADPGMAEEGKFRCVLFRHVLAERGGLCVAERDVVRTSLGNQDVSRQRDIRGQEDRRRPREARC